MQRCTIRFAHSERGTADVSSHAAHLLSATLFLLCPVSLSLPLRELRSSDTCCRVVQATRDASVADAEQTGRQARSAHQTKRKGQHTASHSANHGENNVHSKANTALILVPSAFLRCAGRSDQAECDLGGGAGMDRGATKQGSQGQRESSTQRLNTLRCIRRTPSIRISSDFSDSL